MSKDRSRLTEGSPVQLAENAEYLEEMYGEWKKDPSTVGDEWQAFFRGFELAKCPRTCQAAVEAHLQSKVASLIYAYRDQGHLIAKLDPLGNNLDLHPYLQLDRYGLTDKDLDRVFDTGHIQGAPQRASLREIIAILDDTYCRSVGVEYLHIQDVTQRRWLQNEMEPVRNRPEFAREKKLETLELLTDAEVFEKFVGKRYPGQKRFSLEGAESLIPAIHSLVELAPELGVEEVVVGMAHRGRLNVLANILDKPYAMIFSEFDGNFLAESVGGDGDVKYHKGYSSTHHNHRNNRPVRVSLTSNPSHLEAVNPVVEGRVRAKQRQRDDTELRRKVVPFLIHGDAAFAGQGLVAETFNLSQLEGYRTGGTVHLIVNNQIGFTTSPRDARSTQYSTDVAKMVEAPIFHVNGDDPEAVVFVIELALRYRQEFGRDVVVDMICYRRHGHNEGDEPAFTQPLLYGKIKDRPSVRELYIKSLMECCELTRQKTDALSGEFQDKLQNAFEYVKEKHPELDVSSFDEKWYGLDTPYSHEPAETGVKHPVLLEVSRALNTVPDGFRLNPKVSRILPMRLDTVERHGELDWAHAELLAFGTLLLDGFPVRLSGQDSARGTFSQRHATWHDMETDEAHTPLNEIGAGQSRFCVHNSLLSEAAVLGFEYGYSLAEPDMLVLWEAQFGDFSNGAQVIIDQFIVSSQSKWQRVSGLVMLLPHGYEGQGPEHSNAYLERYLMACAEDNIQVCNLTTPAQYFHALRRQLHRSLRRPLIVMAPKSLLRHPLARSPVDDLVRGRFEEVLDDPDGPARPERLLLCSGKVYYDLIERRRKDGFDNAAIVRLEQFHPFPEKLLARIKKKYSGVSEVVWVQEEPMNRGGWSFVFPRLFEIFPDMEIRYSGRRPSASPATGSLRIHKSNQERLVGEAFLGKPDSASAKGRKKRR